MHRLVKYPNRLARAAWRGLRERLRGPAFPYLERAGLHVTTSGWSSPSPDLRDLSARDVFGHRSELPGLDIREAEQLALLDHFEGCYRGEYSALTAPPHPGAPDGGPPGFRIDNDFYGSVDAEVLYCFVRDRKPTRVIEIGSGNSTLVTAMALERNRGEGGAGELMAIEPYPSPLLRGGIRGLTRLIERPVQEVPLAEFEALGPGDILFIDSSHIVKTGSDVCYEFLEVLPRLRSGVAVHVHDIFLPDEYPREWIVDSHYFWNEQYLLQALLIGSSMFEVRWAGRYMHGRHPDRLRRAFDSYSARRAPGVFPSAFWIERVG